MVEHMYDLCVTDLDGGMLRLEQSAGIGETATIDLHLCQVRLIAERAGLIRAAAAPVWIVHRVKRIHARADHLGRMLASAPSFPPGLDLGDDVLTAIDLLDDIEDLLADLDETSSGDETQPKPSGNPVGSCHDAKQPDLLEAAGQ